MLLSLFQKILILSIAQLGDYDLECLPHVKGEEFSLSPFTVFSSVPLSHFSPGKVPCPLVPLGLSTIIYKYIH